MVGVIDIVDGSFLRMVDTILKEVHLSINVGRL